MENNVNQIELKFQRFFISNFPKVKNYASCCLSRKLMLKMLLKIFSVSFGYNRKYGLTMKMN